MLAGLLVSNVAFLGSLFYLYRLTEQDWGRRAAVRAAWLLTVFPTAFFTFAPYTEGLFLLAATGAVFHARHVQPLRAGLWLAVALLTRSTGIILIAPVVYSLWRPPWLQRVALFRGWSASTGVSGGAARRAHHVAPPETSPDLPEPRFRPALAVAAALAPPVAGCLAFALYLSSQLIPIDALTTAQRGWHRALTYPWTGFTASLAWFTHRHIYPPWALENLLQLAVTVVFLGLSVMAARDLSTPFRLYFLGFWLLVLTTPEWRDAYYAPFSSMDRFVLVLFPLACWSAMKISGRAMRPLISISSLLMGGAAAVHLAGGWVG